MLTQVTYYQKYYCENCLGKSVECFKLLSTKYLFRTCTESEWENSNCCYLIGNAENYNMCADIEYILLPSSFLLDDKISPLPDTHYSSTHILAFLELPYRKSIKSLPYLWRAKEWQLFNSWKADFLFSSSHAFSKCGRPTTTYYYYCCCYH